MTIYGYRTFLMCLGVILVATVGLFTKFLTGSEWITAVSLAFTAYGAKSVAETKIQRSVQSP